MNHSIRKAAPRGSVPPPFTPAPPLAPAAARPADPGPRVLVLCILILGLTAGGTLYLLRPQDYDTLAHLDVPEVGANVPTARPAHPPSETSRQMVQFLENATPQMRERLGLTGNDAPAVTSPVVEWTGGLKNAEALNAFFTQDPYRPEIRQRGERLLQESEGGGIEDMAHLLQRLPANQDQERGRGLSYLVEQTQNHPELTPRVRSLLAELTTQPNPVAPQAYWHYLRTNPTPAEQQQVLTTALSAQTDEEARSALEHFQAEARAPASVSSETAPEAPATLPEN